MNFGDVLSVFSLFFVCKNFPKAHALIPIDLYGDGNQSGHTQMFEGHTQQTTNHFKRGRTCCLKSLSTNNDSLQERAQLLFEGCTQQTSTHFKRGRTWLPNLYYLITHTQQANKRMKDRAHQSLGVQQFTRSHIAKCKCREEKEDLERLQTIY